MFQGCLGQGLRWGLIIGVILWAIANPETLAGLVNSLFGLVESVGNSIGTFVTLTVGNFDSLI